MYTKCYKKFIKDIYKKNNLQSKKDLEHTIIQNMYQTVTIRNSYQTLNDT